MKIILGLPSQVAKTSSSLIKKIHHLAIATRIGIKDHLMAIHLGSQKLKQRSWKQTI